jgi:hypothetical protein
MHAPTLDHWATVKQILRYLKSFIEYGLTILPFPSTIIHTLLIPTGMVVQMIGILQWII